MVSLGVPELLAILGIVSFQLIPLAGLVWALVTLQRIRTTQEAMRLKLEAIERSLGSA
jgi:hypothetical protein